MTEEDHTPSPASIAMDEAIEANLDEGRLLYPDRSLFVNAEGPNLGDSIAEALDAGRAVVLCYSDGTRRVVESRAPVSAT